MEVTLGKYSYGDVHRRGHGNKVRIGAFTSIAENVIFAGGVSHNPALITTFPFNCVWPGFSHLKGHPKPPIDDIIVGNDVYIGMSVLIMEGVHIGDGAVIGAKAVVTKSIPPYEVWGGIPAKFIKKRFSDEHIAKLLELKWWEKDDSEIEQIVPLLMSSDLEALFKLYEM